MSNSNSGADSKNVSPQGNDFSKASPPLFSVERTSGDLVIVVENPNMYVATNARMVGGNIAALFESWDRESGRMLEPTKRPLAAWRTIYGPWHVLDSRVSTILGQIDNRFEP